MVDVRGAIMQVADPRVRDAFENFNGFSEVPADVTAALVSVSTRPSELHAFRPRALAGAALAAASVSPIETEVLKSICDIAALDLHAFESHDITMLAWALAAASCKHWAVLRALGDEVAERAWEFNAEELAKVAQAFAEMGVRHDGMLSTLAMETMWKIDHFSARSLASLANSFEKLGFWRRPTLEWMAARVVGRLADFQPRDLADILSLLSRAGIKNDVFISAAASEVSRKAETLNDDGLEILVQALVQLGEAPRGIAQPFYHSHLVS